MPPECCRRQSYAFNGPLRAANWCDAAIYKRQVDKLCVVHARIFDTAHCGALSRYTRRHETGMKGLAGWIDPMKLAVIPIALAAWGVAVVPLLFALS